MMRTRALCMLGLAASLAAAGAQAGSISVGPTVIELSAGKRIASVRVQNTGPQQTIVQLETVAWTQTVGGDQYAASEDLLATPTVFQLAPGESRDVRVGLKSSVPELTERSFRLYVREVVPTRAESSAQLSFAIRIAVPVFVRGARNTDAALSWSTTTGSDPACRQLSILNSGGSRVHALRVEYLQGSQVLWHSNAPIYILAGTQRVVDPACLPDDAHANLRLRLTTDSGTAIVPPATPSS